MITYVIKYINILAKKLVPQANFISKKHFIKKQLFNVN